MIKLGRMAVVSKRLEETRLGLTLSTCEPHDFKHVSITK